MAPRPHWTKEIAMKRIALLVCTILLAAVALGVPAAVSSQTCTCTEEQQACTSYCQSILCRRAISMCSPSDPCAATCTCSICAP
jgi:hypothetical protein